MYPELDEPGGGCTQRWMYPEVDEPGGGCTQRWMNPEVDVPTAGYTHSRYEAWYTFHFPFSVTIILVEVSHILSVFQHCVTIQMFCFSLCFSRRFRHVNVIIYYFL